MTSPTRRALGLLATIGTVVALVVGGSASSASAESSFAPCPLDTSVTGVLNCAFPVGQSLSVTLTTTTGVLNARVAYVQHPSLTPAELCSVVARSGAISVRNCAGELSHSMVSTHPAVSMGSPGTYVWTFSNMPEGSWVEFSQNSAAHVEFTDFATTPWPEPPTTTSSTTTTTSTTSTTTAPVLEEVAAAIEVSDARAATRSVVGLGFALLVCVVALFVLLAIAVNVGRR